MQLPLWVSNRHIHLSKADAEALFWEWYELTPIKELSQPWQYAAEECVILKWPKWQIEKVRILWPYRPQTQVEILMADQFKLWVMAPIRLSGDLKHSAWIDIIAPDWKQISISEWMIIAKRHIHMTPADAEHFWVVNNQIVQIKYGGERWLIFDEVVVRVTDSSKLDTHIDVEEANAGAIPQASSVELLPRDSVRLYQSNNQVYA
jgi:putative phosphotransacetylase